MSDAVVESGQFPQWAGQPSSGDWRSKYYLSRASLARPSQAHYIVTPSDCLVSVWLTRGLNIVNMEDNNAVFDLSVSCK